MSLNISKLNSLIDRKSTSKAMIIRETGISRPALDAILSGNDFKVSNLEKIAKSLKINIGYLFDEESIQIRKAGQDYVERDKIELKENQTSAIEINLLKEQIELLKAQLADKDEIIRLLREKQ